jgi:hypothetical protein
LAGVLYNNARHFTRSVHVSNVRGRMALRSGDFVPRDQLPAPIGMCVSPAEPMNFAFHAWDNDSEAEDDPYAFSFDNHGEDDDVVIGFRRRLGTNALFGVQVARSGDLEVRFTVNRSRGISPSCGTPTQIGGAAR